MHELSLVAELVDECVRRADGRDILRVRVRHATTISEETLRQAFVMLTAEGPLVGARLDTEAFAITLHCTACKNASVLDHDHAIGHLRVCPACGTVSDDPQPCELELAEMVLTPELI
jgi:Zn finger protein HypA/HybF involved in hydrogenase expression